MRRWLVGLLVIGVLGGLIALAAISTLLGGVGSGDFIFGGAETSLSPNHISIHSLM